MSQRLVTIGQMQPAYTEVGRNWRIPLVIALLLMFVTPCFSQRISPPPTNSDVPVVFLASARDTNTLGGLPIPQGQGLHGHGFNNGPTPFIDHFERPKGLRGLFLGREMERMIVIRYIPGRLAQTEDVVRRHLFELNRRQLEDPFGEIMWSEGALFTIDAVIQFSEGPTVRLLTDGSHSCLIDEAGRPWFFRISPAEFQCGFAKLDSGNKIAAPDSYCQKRGLGAYLQDSLKAEKTAQ